MHFILEILEPQLTSYFLCSDNIWRKQIKKTKAHFELKFSVCCVERRQLQQGMHRAAQHFTDLVLTVAEMALLERCH